MSRRRTTSPSTWILDMDRTIVFTTAEEPDSVERLRGLGILRDIELKQRICRFEVCDATTAPGSGCREEMWGVIRPGLDEFLDTAERTVDYIVIWSAGTPRYVDETCRYIFAGRRPPDLILHRNSFLENGRPIEGKPLSRLVGHPHLPGFSLARSLIADDRGDNFLDNPGNGVLIPPYEPEWTVEGIRRPDDALPRLSRWWRLNADAPDFRILDKSRIFVDDSPIESRLAALSL